MSRRGRRPVGPPRTNVDRRRVTLVRRPRQPRGDEPRRLDARDAPLSKLLEAVNAWEWKRKKSSLKRFRSVCARSAHCKDLERGLRPGPPVGLRGDRRGGRQT